MPLHEYRLPHSVLQAQWQSPQSQGSWSSQPHPCTQAMTAWPAALETQGRHRPRFPFTDLADLRCKPILGSTLTHRALDACPSPSPHKPRVGFRASPRVSHQSRRQTVLLSPHFTDEEIRLGLAAEASRLLALSPVSTTKPAVKGYHGSLMNDYQGGEGVVTLSYSSPKHPHPYPMDSLGSPTPVLTTPCPLPSSRLSLSSCSSWARCPNKANLTPIETSGLWD